MKIGSITLTKQHLIFGLLGLLAAGFLAFLIFVIVALSTFSGIKSTGVDYETQLTAIDKKYQNQVSAFRAGFYEQFNVAKVKQKALDQILENAVSARYKGDAKSMGRGGQLFSAITEAYPDLGGLDVYDRVVDYIRAGRENTAAIQDELQDRVRVYNRWRQAGLFHPTIVRLAGFPSNALTTTRGGTTLHGQAALDKIEQLILTDETNQIFQTGKDTQLKVQ